MKRIICLCNTYYQLIFAFQLKKTIYKDDCFVLLISDQSKSADKIAKSVENLKFFEEVHFVSTKKIDYETGSISKKKQYFEEILQNIGKPKFDEFLFYNISQSTTFLFSRLYAYNKQIKCFRFEEGILSYGNFLKHIPLTLSWYVNHGMYCIRKIVPKINYIDKIQGFYCYYPSIYGGTFERHAVPLINKGDVGEVIVKAFGVNCDELEYKEKYIFFTSVYDFEGGEPIGELELVRKIASAVGKENLLIKMHPRDTRTVYEEEGFHIDTNSSVPFEALLFAYDFSDKVLLTATSGAVLSASLMLENPPKTYYMYPLCNIDGNSSAKGTVSQIDAVLSHDSMQNKVNQIHICNRVDDIVHEV